MIYFYDIKTNKSELVYSTPKHPKWMHSAEVTDCGKYLIITTCESCDPVNSVLLKEISSGKITNVVENFESEYSYLTNIGKIFYFKTNSKATRNRIISINIETLEMDEIVKETSDVLENCGVMSCGSKLLLVLVYLSDCKNTMKVRTLNGDGDDEKEIKLPSLGTIGAIRLRRDSDEMFYSFTSFLYPGTVYHLQFHKSFEEDLTQKVVFDMKVEGFDRDSFETKQIFYESKDGTCVCVFVCVYVLLSTHSLTHSLSNEQVREFQCSLLVPKIKQVNRNQQYCMDMEASTSLSRHIFPSRDCVG